MAAFIHFRTTVFFFVLLAATVDQSQADFFEFMSQSMKWMGRVMGIEMDPAESRAAPDASRTAERIRALHDAAKFVSDAQEKAGKRVMELRKKQIMDSMAGLSSDSSSSSSGSSSDSLGTLLSDTDAGSSSSSSSSTSSTDSLSSLLSETSSTSSGSTSLADLLSDSASLSSASSLSALLDSVSDTSTSSSSSSSTSGLDALLRRRLGGRSSTGSDIKLTRRQLNLLLAKLVVEKLKQRRRMG